MLTDRQHQKMLRLAQRGYLDAMLEVGFQMQLWRIQRQIALAISKPHARVAVPSANSSGKTAVAGGLALAFYAGHDGAKVVTTSPREGQLRDNLWGEIRRFGRQRTFEFPGHIPESGMRVTDGRRLLVGISPAEVEGVKGYHGPATLVIVDEASALDHEMAGGLNTLLASGDARMLLLFNPTDTNSWAAEMCESGGFEVIRIRAWDTPLISHMTNEEIRDRWGVELEPERKPISEAEPTGAALISPRYLDDLVKNGQGPGSFQWQTSVEAKFWEHGSDTIVPKEYYDAARKRQGLDGEVVFGIDLASYGDSESVVAIRRGNRLVALHAHAGFRTDRFWSEIVAPLVQSYDPACVRWDADGPGAGSFTDAERVCGPRRALPFRGSYPIASNHLNARALHYWHLRQRCEWNDIAIAIDDPTLRKQLTSITFKHRNGKIVVDSKAELRRRGVRHIDRADSVMYSFSLDPPTERKNDQPAGADGLSANDRHFWNREEKDVRRRLALPRSRRPIPLR